MNYLFMYGLFALTTSITSLVLVCWPLMKQAREAKVDNVFTQHTVLVSIVFFCVHIIIAPFIFFAMLSTPTIYTSFVNGLQSVVMSEE